MDAGLASWLDAGLYFDYLGFDIFYRIEGSGPPLLLIHGYPFNSFDWQLIWPTLTQRFTVIAPDMLGMGFSAKPVAYEYSVHDHADMHEALLAAPGYRATSHILAHDIGDSVGQELLARHEFGQNAYGAPSYRFDHLAQRRHVRRDLHAAGRAEAAVGNSVGRHPESVAEQPAVASSRWTRRCGRCSARTPNRRPHMMDVFNQILDYNDGRRVLHKVGRFIKDRYTHRNRWVRAMRETDVSMRLIDGPVDPNSGAHMARRYAEVIPDADVVMLADDIGHWPQLEAPDAVLTHFLAHIDRVTAES